MPPRKASPSTPVDFSIAGPKVFSNPNYKQKRNKTLKQILAGERERSDRLARERREREIIKVENQNTGGQASLKKQEPVEIMNCEFTIA